MRKLLNKRKKRTKVFVIIGLFVMLFVGIGYSYLRETLTINSNTEISSMKWDVHLENVKVTSGSITPVSEPTIGSDKLSVTTSLDFTQPAQFYEYTVDVKNDGSIDAMIDSYDSTVLSEAQSKYLIYTATYSDGERVQNNQILKAGEKETIRVRIEVKEDLQKADLPTDGDEIKITFKLNYVQADDDAVDRSIKITYVNRQNEGQITPGDVIRIGDTEEFYVVSSDSTKTVLLAKYNLLLGNIVVEDYSVTGTIPITTTGYGLQSSEATGYDGDGNYWATTKFSTPNYWVDESGNLISPYNENGASFDGNPYPYVYGSNSTIYQYISGENGYIAKLKAMGAPSSITGRLLSYEEADGIKEVKDNGTSIIFDGNQSYWLGSSNDNEGIWSVIIGSNNFTYGDTAEPDIFGVRPVIEMSTSDIK